MRGVGGDGGSLMSLSSNRSMILLYMMPGGRRDGPGPGPVDRLGTLSREGTPCPSARTEADGRRASNCPTIRPTAGPALSGTGGVTGLADIGASVPPAPAVVEAMSDSGSRLPGVLPAGGRRSRRRTSWPMRPVFPLFPGGQDQLALSRSGSKSLPPARQPGQSGSALVRSSHSRAAR